MNFWDGECGLEGLSIDEERITYPGGVIRLDDLPDPQPAHPARMRGGSPMLERLWRVALADVERNVIRTDAGTFLGSGAHFGATVFTRDISYSGVLSLNRLYPDIMRQSLDYAVRQRLSLGYRVQEGYRVEEIQAPWMIDHESGGSDRLFIERHGTNCFMRRTDDVVWLWAAGDLLEREGRERSTAEWIFELGNRCEQELYAPLFDPSDGLYYGQASFIDIHFLAKKSAGYPLDWEIRDCVLQKATSTNALHVRGMEVLARAAEIIGRDMEVACWRRRADELRLAMLQRLRHPSGSWAFYKDSRGVLSERREALGAALVVLLNVVEGVDAGAAVAGYPITPHGIPLFQPFFEDDRCYHNNTSWPFVEAFFLKAVEQACGLDTKPLTLAYLARSCVEDGTFHEVVDYRTGKAGGSGSQLWTAAAFLGACLRSGYEVSDCP